MSQPPLKASRRVKNLRDLLVHSDSPPAQPAQQPGTFPCMRTICRTCPHINQSTSIPSPGGQIKITGHFTCTSDNVIYCISCRKCPRAVYIGATGCRLADRFREHRLDVLHKKSDLPVAQHFNSPGHSLEVVRVAVLKSGLARKDVRQREEMRQILKSRFLIYMKSRDTLAHFSQTVSKRHTHANNCRVILRGSKEEALLPEEGSNAETSVVLYRHLAFFNYILTTQFLQYYVKDGD